MTMGVELLQTVEPQLTHSAECVQALLLAALPMINQFLERADADLSPRVTTNQVQSVAVRYDRHGPGAAIMLTNGWAFNCERGMIVQYASPREFTAIEDFGRISDYFGKLNYSQTQALAKARQSLGALGYREDELFFNLEPGEIEGPRHEGKNVVPYYMFTWADPRGNSTVTVGLNGTTGKIQLLDMHAYYLLRSNVLSGAFAESCESTVQLNRDGLNPEFMRQYVPLVLDEGTHFLRRLGKLPEEELNTNQVKSISIAVRGLWPIARVTLTNGLRFALVGRDVYQYEGANALWRPPPEPIDLSRLTGDWRLSERQALRKAREWLELSGYDLTELGANRGPAGVTKPRTAGAAYEIPRFKFRWEKRNGRSLSSMTHVEINAESGDLEGLTVQEFARPNRPTGIDTPILTRWEERP